MAEVECVWERGSRRSVRSPFQRHALHHWFPWADPGHGHGRAALLEGRARCSRRRIGPLRLPRGLQSEPARELRGWWRGERGLGLCGLGWHDRDWWWRRDAEPRAPRDRAGIDDRYFSRGDAGADREGLPQEISCEALPG